MCECMFFLCLQCFDTVCPEVLCWHQVTWVVWLWCVGERAFPPAVGLTYCTWFCVDKFSCTDADSHPVRLLTICRHLQHRDDNLVCLAIFLSAKDRALLISTQELPLLTSAQGPLSLSLVLELTNQMQVSTLFERVTEKWNWRWRIVGAGTSQFVD